MYMRKPVKYSMCKRTKKEIAILDSRPILSVKCFFFLFSLLCLNTARSKRNPPNLTYIILCEKEQNYVG